jgi:hypothetical protein
MYTYVNLASYNARLPVACGLAASGELSDRLLIIAARHTASKSWSRKAF